MKLVSVAEMQSIEREANAHGLSYAQMMENAGSGLAQVILEELGFLEEEGALGLVGSGNNGGDALVTLALLARQGWKATACLLRPRPQDDPLLTRLIAVGGSIRDFSAQPDLKLLAELIQTHGILLDGVLGTGLKLPLKPELSQMLGFVRDTLGKMEAAPVVIAVDCPSGIDCDSGEAAPDVIPADLTVTMAAFKQGLLKFPAFSMVGETRLVGIGLPEEGDGLASWRAIRSFIVDQEWVHSRLPVRALDAHKGTFGTALIVAGSISYTGAAFLAGKAAYRSGAGLVTLAIPSPLHAALAGQFPEATWLLLPHTNGYISEQAGPVVTANLERVTSLLIGPGFGLEQTTQIFLDQLLAGHGLPPLVIDADALKLLTEINDWPAHLPSLSILTPHPGEMSILTGLSRDIIQADRLNIVQRFSREWGQIVVLKGAFTLIAAPDGRTAMIPVASPALARAGTGDVLAGLITGLRAQGMPAFEAAAVGAWIHASAGVEAAEILGNTASVLAGDVLAAIPQVLSELA